VKAPARASQVKETFPMPSRMSVIAALLCHAFPMHARNFCSFCQSAKAWQFMMICPNQSIMSPNEGRKR